MIFWYSCIYLNNFAFDDDAVLSSETICLDEWVSEFPEVITISVPTKVEVGSNAFFGVYSTHQSTQLYF